MSYAYDAFDNLTEIHRGDGLKYVLQYNQYHNLESIGVDGKEEKLVHYTYKTGNGRLKQVTYANGDYMKAVYNNLGQMIAEKWYDAGNTLTAHYKYTYDCQGNIVRSVDILACKEYNYYYEEGRITRAVECDITINADGNTTSKTVVNTLQYYYDKDGELIRRHLIPASDTYRQISFYEEDANGAKVLKVKHNEKVYISHSRNDSFGRKEFDEVQTGWGTVSRQFFYTAGKAPSVYTTHSDRGNLKSTPTTNLVSQIILSDGRTLSYEYDAEERIIQVTDSVEGITQYTYDALGQLLTETVNGTVVNAMTYDNYGNILSKNGKPYAYGDGSWKDKLTAYDGQPISYDAQGNPTTYLGHTLTWEKGRQLKSFDGNTYTYNANGIRTSKTVNGVKHTYTLDGTKIIQETWPDIDATNTPCTRCLIPLYDNEDSVCGILYDDIPYYFLKNLQGDIIAITNHYGDVLARYSYDAWGVCTITSDSSDCAIATINPFRYRGYYYDAEIGMYYLQNRYYNPTTGRFISGDDVALVESVSVRHSHNLYCYCCNNPVNDWDLSGYLSVRAIAKFILWGIFGLFVQYVSDLIEYLYRKYIQKKNVPFSASPAGDYLSSAISWGMCTLNLFNNKLAAFLAPFIPVFVKHIVNICRSSFSWYGLLVDVMSAFIAGIISVALSKKMSDKLRKLKRGSGNRYADYSKYLKNQQKIVAKINKVFLKVSISIIIPTSLIQLILNLLFK